MDQIPEFELRLQSYMENAHPEVLTAIRSTGKLEADTEAALSDALKALLAEFQGMH